MQNKYYMVFPSLIALVLISLPMIFGSQYAIHLGILILIWSIVCLSLNLIFGYAGQISLAQGGLFGAAAYLYGILAVHYGVSFWVGLPIACLFTGLIGAMIGILSLRLTGPYFVIVTLGFNVILTSIVMNMKITGGVVGLMGIPPINDINLSLFNINFGSKVTYYYFTLICLVLVIALTYRIKNSLFGKSLIALSKDEDLCRSVGINTMEKKVKAFIISSVLAGFAGVIYAAYIGIMTPREADYHASIDVLVYLVVGGVGTIAGAIAGPGIMILLQESLSEYGEVKTLIHGAVLIVFVIFMSKGITGTISRFTNNVRGK